MDFLSAAGILVSGIGVGFIIGVRHGCVRGFDFGRRAILNEAEVRIQRKLVESSH